MLLEGMRSFLKLNFSAETFLCTALLLVFRCTKLLKNILKTNL